MGSETCAACPSTRAELAAANKTILALVAEKSELLRENAELNKRVTLLEGDVERYKKAIAEQPTPHQPERVSKDQLQLGLDGVLESLQGQPLGESVKNAVKAANDEPKAGEPSASTSEPSAKPKRGHRRNLLASNLPVINELIDPPEVVMDGFEGWVQLKPEVTLNLARRSPYVVLRIERRRWAKKTPENTRIALADLPPSAAPGMMADAGVIASVVMDKYGSLAPLHRQEQGSSWRGFHLPRSTLSDWCGYAYEALSPIVDAMHADLVRESSVIATDATGAPVRCKRGTLNWHVFTFIGDAQHITFRDVRRHDGASIGSLLKGFSGRLLVDAASIYDRLPERGIQLLSCWSHARRYFWKATKTESRLAHEALSLIDGLFRIDKNAKQMSVGARGEYRAQHSRVLLDALDVWVTSASERAEPGGRLEKALTYYGNQRDSLRRFLDDARLELTNNVSERQLRPLVVGLNNWMHFENKTGLAWFATFRSLIASCRLHGMNPLTYLEEVLRVARHWKGDRLPLSPKHWPGTRASLSGLHRAAIEPGWRDRVEGVVREAPALPASA
jgi:transposase